MRTIVVAVNQDGVLGKDNTIPWHNPEDLKHFKNYTLGKDLIMGRKTMESIGRILPGRKNIIITRDKNYRFSGGVVVHSMEEALDEASTGEVIIGGGANLYQQFLEANLVDRIVMSVIETEEIDGGVMFPHYDEKDWEVISDVKKDSFTIKTLERKK